MRFLDNINSPADLKKLRISDLDQVSAEIREYLIETLSQTGGHLASNLGSVELTVALHYVYDSPHDRFCWDVGHQTYVHKILTGRKDRLNTVRTLDGLAGFPKIDESEHDHYNVGHAGTSISQAVAEAYARDLKMRNKQQSKPNDVIAIIGDASIATGMAFEAMNHGGGIKSPFLIILNDNEMSISENVGALSYSLSTLISTRFYKKGRRILLRMLRYIPVIGPVFERLFLRFTSSMKSILTDHQFFQELGLRYIGPIDGHDVKGLVKIFQRYKSLERPVLLHIVTKKGKGYDPAEKNPIKYHGISPFETSTGATQSTNGEAPLSQAVGETLTRLAFDDKDIVVITPAMIEGSGLISFARTWPERLVDTGIAEEHAATFSGGLAKNNLKPFLCIYSTFLQRGYGQLIHDICLMNLPVRIVLDRAGCVGGDGETHQGLFDIAYMAAIPNIKILSASSAIELMYMLTYMKDYNESPVSVRFPRRQFSTSDIKKYEEQPLPANFSPFKSEIVRQSKTELILILAEGYMVQNALEAARILQKKNIDVTIVSLKCIRPLDTTTLTPLIKKAAIITVVENHASTGGVFDLIATEFLDIIASDKSKTAKKMLSVAYPVKPLEHGSVPEIEQRYGLDPASIADQIEKTARKHLPQLVKSKRPAKKPVTLKRKTVKT